MSPSGLLSLVFNRSSVLQELQLARQLTQLMWRRQVHYSCPSTWYEGEKCWWCICVKGSPWMHQTMSSWFGLVLYTVNFTLPFIKRSQGVPWSFKMLKAQWIFFQDTTLYVAWWLIKPGLSEILSDCLIPQTTCFSSSAGPSSYVHCWGGNFSSASSPALEGTS